MPDLDPLHLDELARRLQSAPAVLLEPGMRMLIDSEALHQAVYLYRPIFDDDGLIVDLEIVKVNEAARNLPLSTHVVEGVLASDVFVDLEDALLAANTSWQGQQAKRYLVERRGYHEGQPTVVRFEVATTRVGDYLMQVSVDRTTDTQLATADARFRRMAEATSDVLMLLLPEPIGNRYLLMYANPAALAVNARLRIGARLPPDLGEVAHEAIEALRHTSPVRRLLERDLLARRVVAEATFIEVGDGQVLVTARELTSEQLARAELERSDRVLRAIGAGAFGTIAVYEPRFEGDRLVDLRLMWSASGHGHGGGRRAPLDPTSVISATDLLAMAQAMSAKGERERSGWVPVAGDDDDERSVEFTFVVAGDRFVLEFVERTEELAARTALAMVTATSDAQRSFLSRVSHELRSPLNVIHGYSQLLGRLHLPDPAPGYVVHIDRGVSQMVQIIDDLLLLGQIDQGLLRIDARAMDVGELAADVARAIVREPWWRAQLVVHVGGGPQGVTVRTDAARFAMTALLIAEASAAVGAPELIELGPFARGTRGGLQFVTDAASTVVSSVWMPFVTSHTIPGAGLGLAVARGLVRALDLTVEVRDVPGEPPRTALVLLTQTLR